MSDSKKQRPVYTVELGREVCRLVAEGETLDGVVRALNGAIKRRTILDWLADHDEFAHQYTRAREMQGDSYADEVKEIVRRVIDPAVAENERLDANQARVAIDALKWAAGKRNPKKYGDKLTLDGDLKVTMPEDQLDSRLGHLLAKAAAKQDADTVH